MISTMDRDLSCLYCGKVVYLYLGRENDYSRGSKRTANQKQTNGDDVDGVSKMARRELRSTGASHHGSALVRQRGLYRRTG